jgi:hypothetical protein
MATTVIRLESVVDWPQGELHARWMASLRQADACLLAEAADSVGDPASIESRAVAA